jgi:hypothetical protein
MGLLGNNLDAMQSHKRLLNKQFKIKDLDNIKQILGIAIDYNCEAQTLHMYQTRYIDKSVEHYGFANGHTHRWGSVGGSRACGPCLVLFGLVHTHSVWLSCS